MIEAYKIGVSLILDTNIPGAIGRVISEFEKLNGIVKEIQEGVKGLAGNIRSLANAADKLGAAAGKMGGGTSGMASDSAKVADNFERAVKAANAMVAAPRLLGYGGGNSGSVVSSPLMLGYSGGSMGSETPSILRLTGPTGGDSGGTLGAAWTPSGSGGGGMSLPPIGGSGGAGGGGMPPPLRLTGPSGGAEGALGAAWEPSGGGAGGGGMPPPLRLTGPSGGAEGALGAAWEPSGGGAGGGGMPPIGGVGGGPSLGGIMSGVFAVEIGVQMVERFFSLLNQILEKADAFNTELTKLRMSGVSEANTAQLASVVRRVAQQVPGRTYDQIMIDAQHMRASLGEEQNGDPLGVIEKYLPQVEQSAAAIAFKTGENSTEAMKNVLRALDLRGDLTDPKTHEIDPARFSAGLEWATKFLEAANGVAGSRDIFNLMKQAGPAARMMDDPKTFYESMLAAVIDMGGARAGTALTAAMRQLVGGIVNKTSYNEGVELGLYKPDSYKSNGGGGYGRVDPAGLNGKEILEAGGLFAYEDQVVRQRLAAKGISDSASINRELYRMLNTETFRRLASLYLTQAQQVTRDATMMNEIPSVEEQNKLMRNGSASFASTALGAAWDNMWADITGDAVPGRIAAMNAIAAAIRNIGDSAVGGPASTFGTDGKLNIPIVLPWWARSPLTWFDKDYGHGVQGPMHVVVDNMHEVGPRVTGGLSDGFSRPQSGPTNTDPRIDAPMTNYGGGLAP